MIFIHHHVHEHVHEIWHHHVHEIMHSFRHQARGIWVRLGTTPASIVLLSLLFEPLSALFQALHHSASNICQASIVCQHLPVTSAQASNICQQHLLLTALNLNSQHLNGPNICPSIRASISSISANICQHLASISQY